MSISTYRNVIVQSFIFFVTGLVGCRSVVPDKIVSDKKTDSVTKLAIHYLNENKPDSLYQLTGERTRKHITATLLASFTKEKLPYLLPLTKVTFITKNDSVSVYKIDGKIPINFYISLDKLNKIDKFSLLPYQKELKAVAMSADEKRTDELAHKVLTFINRQQDDSAYALAGDQFKSKVNAVKWRDFADNAAMLTSVSPFFLRSNKGINVYIIRSYQFSFGDLAKDGKFNAFGFQPYPESAVKATKAATDNKLITQLDKVADKILSAYIQTQGNVGISAGVFYKGKSYFYNYGERKKGSNNLPDDHTLYEIGSITKTFTSTLLAMAVNEQKVTLETSITKFLPDSVAQNPALKKITFKELANHTAGFPRMPAGAELMVTDVDQPFGNYGINDMFSFLKHFKQIRQPGVKSEYSNFGVGLLGVLLEKIYHKTYPELIRNYITVPLKMNETMAIVDTLKFKNVAQGYGQVFEPVPFMNLTAVRSAGIIKSSTADLITYAKAQLLTPDAALSAAIKLTHQVTFKNDAVIVGLGWHYFPDDKNVLQHGGATGGCRASVCIDLSKQIGVVILTNNAGTGDMVGRNLIKAIQAIKSE